MTDGHRKRNITLVAVAIVIVLVLTILIYQFNASIQVANIDYSLDESVHRFYLNESNAITLYCNNVGGKDGNFYLVLNFTNAAFSNQTEQPYVQVNASTVKFPFSLHRAGEPEDSISKLVYFVIGERAEYFSFYLSLEKIDKEPRYSLGSVYGLEYTWNASGKYYQQSGESSSMP